jgi:hypothetical protein
LILILTYFSMTRLFFFASFFKQPSVLRDIAKWRMKAKKKTSDNKRQKCSQTDDPVKKPINSASATKHHS